MRNLIDKRILFTLTIRKISITLFMLAICAALVAQIDAEQLALDVSKAEQANTEKLLPFIWKRYSTATVDGEVKATVITEFKFDENGELNATQVGGESNVKKKPEIRGRIQESAIENNVDYVSKALELALSYTFMSKGQLLDFFEKGLINEKDNAIQVTAGNIYMKGDSLTVLVDKETKLFIDKKFSSMLDEDPINGELKYGTFSSGISHGTETLINLPGKNAIINAENKDYSQRIH